MNWSKSLLSMVMGIKHLFLFANEEYIEIKNLELSNSASHLKTDGTVRLMNGSSRSGEDIRYGILVLRDINGQKYK